MKDENSKEHVNSTNDNETQLQELKIRREKAELQDLEERLAEREMRRETVRQRSRINGETIKQLNRNDVIMQTRCNHKKGGNGADGLIGGQGDDSQYAVFKHRMPNGDVWVRCLRCGKTWKPPVKSMFTDKAGKFDNEGYALAQQEYEKAVAFQTRNQTSGSIQMRYSDGGEFFREVTKNTNLR